jgi:hypothetical protein
LNAYELDRRDNLVTASIGLLAALSTMAKATQMARTYMLRNANAGALFASVRILRVNRY